MNDVTEFVPKQTGWSAWIPVHRKHKHICCQCAAEHYVEQRILEDGTIEERWKLDNRATSARRKSWPKAKLKFFT